MSSAFFAHSLAGTPREEWHYLEQHLAETAEQCKTFSSRFGSGEWGYLAGLWHDLGKYQPAFQRYLIHSQEGSTEATRAPHSAAGAYWALVNNCHPIALAILAHHGSLKKLSELENEVLANPEPKERWMNALPGIPEWIQRNMAPGQPGAERALWVRFLFSALVDADSLDTERFHTGRERESCKQTLPQLLERLEAELTKRGAEEPDTAMNRLRRKVQEAARLSSSLEQGAFRLTVPTGGGKTLASLLFGLHHAITWGLDRVIVVIPYTSIIDQTASEYRRILGDDAVLEHHSNIDPEKESLENRLAAENWDRPVVITTSVQFFETLYAHHKRSLRKLHRVARSVVILDEVQTMPLNLVLPIQGALGQLQQRFAVSVVHCTATQPMLVDAAAREIIPAPEDLFEAVQHRVKVKWPVDLALATNWEELAERIRSERSEQVLVIVNSRADAIELSRILGEGTIHLSALMCAAHRREKLKLIRGRLATGLDCLVVATQLVEAGVDLDFPVVYRALAGFDSLAQAAGRCNRNGRGAEPGRLEVFVPLSREPRYLRGRNLSSKTLLAKGVDDLNDPRVFGEYFKELKREIAGDQKGIVALEEKYDFPSVAANFQMIEEGAMETVIAPWGDWKTRMEELRMKVSAQSLRAMQQYGVSIHTGAREKLEAQGAIEPLFPRHGAENKTESWVVLESQANRVYDDLLGFGASRDLSASNLILD